MTLGVHGEDFRVAPTGADAVAIVCDYCGERIGSGASLTLAQLVAAAVGHDCPRRSCDHGVSHRAACTDCTGPGPNETGGRR